MFKKSLPLPDKITISESLPEYTGFVLRELALAEGDLIHITRNEKSLFSLASTLQFLGDEIEILPLPAWDCLPYDRVSPHRSAVVQRIKTLSQLGKKATKPRILLTSVSGFLQHVPPEEHFRLSARVLKKGDKVSTHELSVFLVKQGYMRTDTVRESGEYAMRGDIIDLFPAAAEHPYRVDLFGNDIEKIRVFDAQTQMTTGETPEIELIANNEFLLDEQSVSRFTAGYLQNFGAKTAGDPLYAAVREQRLYAGMEHWLPLFHKEMRSVTECLPNARVTAEKSTDEAITERLDLIHEYYQARMQVLGKEEGGYKPLHPDQLYLNEQRLTEIFAQRKTAKVHPFATPEIEKRPDFCAGAKRSAFLIEGKVKKEGFWDSILATVEKEQEDGQRIVFTAFSDGSLARMKHILQEREVTNMKEITHWSQTKNINKKTIFLTVLDLETGFRVSGMTVITETDIWGEKLVGSVHRKKRADKVIQEAGSLNMGDLVVHIEHGVGRYDGLEGIEALGKVHDCARLSYSGGDRLYLPVENIDLLSRYGEGEGEGLLDKLGGTAWQSRKAKAKERIREIAGKLIQIAAQRKLKKGVSFDRSAGLYEEFCARFPYVETEDQERAIEDVLTDLASGQPMDRLICGDVGFGKTEVALRAAFVAAMNGKQVAIIAPTTLLARQHTIQFKRRFEGFGLRVAGLSRLVTARDAALVKDGLKEGQIDIVIGTHALLGKTVAFKDLGLVIIDEEQHFGVAQKHKFKEMRAEVHVLTLTATPIPRTLQQSLSGVKELSIIATPPVDRMAVKTFVLPYDSVVIREAIMREYNRGGQIFYVCPRVKDMDEVLPQLQNLVPDIKIAIAHGQMSPTEIEKVMTAFVEHRVDLLLSTQIVESGLDIPSANTIILHRSDMFGLAQLYQLRGRVGRSKTRAYAYLTIPKRRVLNDKAAKRLEVMQTLDNLGAGFTLASHDLDIRGAGNLLGDEQSGHIKEVGVALYQHMLEEAIAEQHQKQGTAGDDTPEVNAEWAPQINLGLSVLIPEGYIAALNLRLSFYQRIAALHNNIEIDALAAEMIDRFGPLPMEVENLLATVSLKNLCKIAHIEKLDAGYRGTVMSFRDNKFPNPAGLVDFMTSKAGTVKIKPDHKLVYMRGWVDVKERLLGVKRFVGELVTLIED
ncbi:MAG: transcription-repair coupling factor [Alphaproteobacteria bacterium]